LWCGYLVFVTDKVRRFKKVQGLKRASGYRAHAIATIPPSGPEVSVERRARFLKGV